ncbi:hypothetical protein, partial [Paenibacillus sp. GCM10027626]|uniref:hypothetical protein n=1 Tax=Paenibacillus sp. GCM10027626 TaxID=3273411 RepID=UPI0036430943
HTNHSNRRRYGLAHLVRKGGSKKPETWLSLAGTMAQFTAEYSLIPKSNENIEIIKLIIVKIVPLKSFVKLDCNISEKLLFENETIVKIKNTTEMTINTFDNFLTLSKKSI